MHRHRTLGLSVAILSALPLFAQTENLTPAALLLRAKAQNAVPGDPV